jgi:hypothetical protein
MAKTSPTYCSWAAQISIGCSSTFVGHRALLRLHLIGLLIRIFSALLTAAFLASFTLFTYDPGRVIVQMRSTSNRSMIATALSSATHAISEPYNPAHRSCNCFHRGCQDLTSTFTSISLSVNFETVEPIAEKLMVEQRGICVAGKRRGTRNSVHRNAWIE